MTEAAELGTVVRVDGDRVVAQVESPAGCAHCVARASCVTVGPGVRHIVVKNILGAGIGDTVEISFPPQARVLSAFLFFLFPVLLALTGFLLGQSIGGGEGSGVVGTFAGFVLAYVVVRVLNPLLERSGGAPTIRRILARADDSGRD
jgi:positive regulator of sigma E activity